MDTLTHLLSFQPSMVLLWFRMFYFCYTSNIYFYDSLPFQFKLCFYRIIRLLWFSSFYESYASNLYCCAFLLFGYTINITEMIILWIMFPHVYFIDDSKSDELTNYLKSHCQKKIMSMLWPSLTYLCTLWFSVVAGRQRVYIPSSDIFSHLYQMTWDVLIL